MVQKKLITTLHINDLELSVNLGWRIKERKQEQAILLNMDIHFTQPPKACDSDKLDDTSCYAKLIELIREKIATKHYRLIEHLSAEIYTIAKKYLSADTKINIRLTKYPRLDGLKGGVTFDYGDEE